MNPLKMIMRTLKREPSCEEVNKFLAEYIEGVLPEKTHDKFHAHLHDCPCCISYFEHYQSTIKLVSEDRETQIPDELVEHTLAFLRANIGPA